MYDKIHPQVGIDGLYLNGKEGGRGLLQTEATNTTELINAVQNIWAQTIKKAIL